eukprot:930979-Amorphochlora_amoeboformis.AAC.1
MDWLLWVLSVVIALLGGFVLNRLGPSPPPVVTVHVDEEEENDAKQDVKPLGFLEGKEKDDKDDADEGPCELVIVAYRLPVKVTKDEDGWVVEWDDPFARNVFADLKLLNRENLTVKWVGTVPGPEVSKGDQFDLEEELEGLSCYPVFLPPTIRNKFYKGFCKIPPPFGSLTRSAKASEGTDWIICGKYGITTTIIFL